MTLQRVMEPLVRRVADDLRQVATEFPMVEMVRRTYFSRRVSSRSSVTASRSWASSSSWSSEAYSF